MMWLIISLAFIQIVKSSDPLGDYLGCWKDSGVRAMAPTWNTYSDNTPRVCAGVCQRRGKSYAGVQAGGACFCADHYQRYGRASNCNYACPGDHSLKCGGAWANSVYEVNPGRKIGKVGEYMGCFRDKASRDMAPKYVNLNDNTPKVCASLCREKGFEYAGVQYGRACFCSNHYGKYGRVANCNMPCPGDNTYMCGGLWANNVYRVNPGRRTGPVGDYLGCYRDAGKRDMAPKYHTFGDNSPHVCAASCQRKGDKYAGLQAGGACFCSNHYGSLGKATNCNYRCPGDNSRFCGGAWANSVYKVRPGHFKSAIKRYIGCYKDAPARDMAPTYVNLNKNTPEACASRCQKQGKKYAGVQYGRACFCSNHYGTLGHASNCNMPCPGDRTLYCGGGWANSVYAVRYEAEKEEPEEKPREEPEEKPREEPEEKPRPKEKKQGGQAQYETKTETQSETVWELGCFKDKPDDRDMGSTWKNLKNNTPHACGQYCWDKGTKYFATQNGNECFCSDHYGSHGAAHNCDKKCPGDESQKCGGIYANSVFEFMGGK